MSGRVARREPVQGRLIQLFGEELGQRDRPLQVPRFSKLRILVMQVLQCFGEGADGGPVAEGIASVPALERLGVPGAEEGRARRPGSRQTSRAADPSMLRRPVTAAGSDG